MSDNAYDAFSTDYDRFVNWEARFAVEMPFLLSNLHALQPASDGPLRVLDAACGTGMHAIRLAAEGFTTAGTDFSAQMIKKAQANARTAHADAVFKTAGFGEICRCASSDLRCCLLMPCSAWVIRCPTCPRLAQSARG